jgi:hypothetical protein
MIELANFPWLNFVCFYISVGVALFERVCATSTKTKTKNAILLMCLWCSSTVARIHSQFESLGFVGKYGQNPTKLVNIEIRGSGFSAKSSDFLRNPRIFSLQKGLWIRANGAMWWINWVDFTECIVGSSNFGTLTYFKQIWIAVKILRSNYKIRFSSYLAISCENGIFGSKK